MGPLEFWRACMCINKRPNSAGLAGRQGGRGAGRLCFTGGRILVVVLDGDGEA